MRQQPKSLDHEQASPQEVADALDAMRRAAGIKDAEPGVLRGAYDDRMAIARVAADTLERENPKPKQTKRKQTKRRLLSRFSLR
jgi:hypothetical protein